MLTVDRLLEKRRSKIAANRLRNGLPTAARSRWCPSEAERERKIESLRQALMAKSRSDLLNYYLLLFDSDERALELWKETAEESSDVFWRVWLDNWHMCDGLWPLRDDMLAVLLRRTADLSPLGFLETQDRHFYDSLPDRVAVYRGCGRRRVRGLPWTTDRDCAAFFAGGGRFSPPRDPVIASAEIDKADIFFVATSRNESDHKPVPIEAASLGASRVMLTRRD